MRVLIATPCYASTTSMHFSASLFALGREAARQGLDLTLHLHSESLITRARNHIAATFLEGEDFTHLFWIDADIAFDPRAFVRLLLADRDVVAGLPPLKVEAWPAGGLPAVKTRRDLDALTLRYPLFPLAAEDGTAAFTSDGLVEVVQAPTGFMVIKRDVLLRMMRRYPELAFAPDASQSRPAGLHWGFFDCMIDDRTREYLSEDYAFCRRWRAIGGRIFADLDCALNHQGQRVYDGDLLHQLNAKGLLSPPRE